MAGSSRASGSAETAQTWGAGVRQGPAGLREMAVALA
jgi:hypothetical protein